MQAASLVNSRMEPLWYWVSSMYIINKAYMIHCFAQYAAWSILLEKWSHRQQLPGIRFGRNPKLLDCKDLYLKFSKTWLSGPVEELTTLHKYPESSQVNGRTNLRKRKGRKGNEGAEMGRFASLAFGWTSLLLCQSKSHTSCGLKGVLTSVFNRRNFLVD